MKDIEVLSLYVVIRLAGYDPVFCLLALRRSQKINWSHHSGDDPQLFSYDFATQQMYDSSLLCASKRSKKGSNVFVDIPRDESCCLQDALFTSITRCEAE